MLTGMEHLAAESTDPPIEEVWPTSLAPGAEHHRGTFEADFFHQVELPSARWLKQAFDA